MRFIVVGAGLAGLSCALHLVRAGHDVEVHEASGRVGGRIGSVRRPDGFVIDRGFQVLFPAYPSVKALLDVPALELKAYEAGAVVRSGDRFYEVADPTRHPHAIMSTMRAPFVTPKDAWAIIKLSADVASLPADQLMHGPELPSTEIYLRKLGFTPEFIERFARPFLGGVFLNRDLATDARIFRFYWKMLMLGPASVPKAGMQAIPDQLAAQLPAGALHLNSPVAALVRDGEATRGVRLASGEVREAEAVIVATDYPQARVLADLKPEFAGNSAINLFFASPRSLTPSRKIILNALPDARVNQVAQPTNVNPAYAPGGQHLVALQVLGDYAGSDDELAFTCVNEIKPWFPGHDFRAWRLLEVVRTPFGQFREEPETMGRLPSARLGPGLFLASEIVAQSSIEGALQGGALAARLAKGV